MELVQTAPRLRPGIAPIVVVVVGSWVLMALLMTGNHSHPLDHDAILAGQVVPDVSTALLFLAAWQVMTGAMMLPSSLPMIHLVARASRRQERPHLVLWSFLIAYFAVWTGFALVALTFDGIIHVTVERWAWLANRPHLISGSVLFLAGAFQFSPLKERCLDACRSPLGFLSQHYRRGIGGAWSLGIRHGVFCLGCCWALMLVMFAVGIGSIAGMAGLTGVMTVEKSLPWGRKLVPAVGVALLAWGGVLVLAPGILPHVWQL